MKKKSGTLGTLIALLKADRFKMIGFTSESIADVNKMSNVKPLFAFVLFMSALLLLSVVAKANEVTVSRLVSVYDGDTFRVDIDDWPAIVGYNMPVRIYGIDTPEIRGKCQRERELAKEAKRIVKSFLEGGRLIILKDLRRGKYFRIIARVNIDGLDIGNFLISRGLAVPYFGGTKTKNWCE